MVHFDQANKSDILDGLKAPTEKAVPARLATVVVLDMAAVVHMMQLFQTMLHNS